MLKCPRDLTDARGTMPMHPHRFRTTVALLLIAGALCVAPSSAAAATEQLVVGFSTDVALATQVAELRDAGVDGLTTTQVSRADIPQLDAAVVAVPAADVAAVRADLLASGLVDYVEVDGTARAFELAPATSDGVAAEGATASSWNPDDTFLPQQWALAKVGATTAWDFSRGTGVTVAVVDTGVDYIHPDLRGKVLAGKDFVDDDNDAMDVQGHGTHVAGIAAGIADDTFGIAGLAPGASILPVRVLDAEGSGDYSDVANGIVYAADHGAKVINLSLGGPDGSVLLKQAVDYASARGSIVTCASGNEGAAALGFPARYTNCFSVGATDESDRRASFSNVGAGLDITAPGVAILSSTMGGSHEAWDGTSMATPYASGLAALLFAQGLSRAQVVEAMTSTARDLGAVGRDAQFGSGRIDAAAATLAASRMPRSAADTTAPVVTTLTVGATRSRVAVRTATRWKTTSTSPWRRFDTTTFGGTYSWREVKTVGTRRTWTYYRSASHVVVRRTIVQRKVSSSTSTTVRYVPVTVRATDGVGVDRVALDIGGRTAGVDWVGADGWTFELPCTAGTRTYTAWAYDAADNEAGGRATATVTC